jgi:hypothetical protein
MEKWIEVPFPSFHIPQVPPMIKSKTQGAKNKVYKPHGASFYLTQKNKKAKSIWRTRY